MEKQDEDQNQQDRHDPDRSSHRPFLNSGKGHFLAYKEKEHPGSVKLVLPSNYSSARISQIPFATGKQLAKMAEHVVSESAAEGIVDYGYYVCR